MSEIYRLVQNLLYSICRVCVCVCVCVCAQVVSRLQKMYGNLYTNDNLLISGIHTHSGPAGYFQYVLFEVSSLPSALVV